MVRAARRRSRRGCPTTTFDGLRAHLFEHEGFPGNIDHYADPENSFLDSVIERRRGIPITLSVLMIAIGRRLGVDVRGVGMPGHFLVLDGARGDVWCDPFHGGALLDADGCRRRFELVYGGALAFQPAFLAPTPAPAIVARMLANLERSELATDPVQRAWMCELHLAIPGHLVPGAVGARRPARGEPATSCAPPRSTTLLAEPHRVERRRRRTTSDAAARLRTRARALARPVELSRDGVPEPRVMPMFPLGTVLFPHALLPLHVFEPRYRVMTERVLKATREFGVVLIERGSEVGGGDTRFDVGTVARDRARPAAAATAATRSRPSASAGCASPGGCPTIRTRRRRWSTSPEPRGRARRRSAAPHGDRACAALDDVCAIYRQRDPRVPELPADRRRSRCRRRTSWPRSRRSARSTRSGCSTTRGRAGTARLRSAELLDDHAWLLRDGDRLE